MWNSKLVSTIALCVLLTTYRVLMAIQRVVLSLSQASHNALLRIQMAPTCSFSSLGHWRAFVCVFSSSSDCLSLFLPDFLTNIPLCFIHAGALCFYFTPFMSSALYSACNEIYAAQARIQIGALCLYDTRMWPADYILALLQTHPFVVMPDTQQIVKNMYYIPPPAFRASHAELR